MQEAFKYIGMVTGLFILLFASIITIVFLAWIVKLEFDWFFGIDISKKFNDFKNKGKVKFAKKLVPVKLSIDEANKVEN